MASTLDTVREVVVGYTGQALNGYVVDAGLVVRVKDDVVIIEHDANDKLLVDALVQAGVPRDSIHLAYRETPTNPI